MWFTDARASSDTTVIMVYLANIFTHFNEPNTSLPRTNVNKILGRLNFDKKHRMLS